MRASRIRLGSPLMIQWAIQVMEESQIIYRGGYPQVISFISHDTGTGYALTEEVVYAS